jgi:hypothetical protein
MKRSPCLEEDVAFSQMCRWVLFGKKRHFSIAGLGKSAKLLSLEKSSAKKVKKDEAEKKGDRPILLVFGVRAIAFLYFGIRAK